MRALRYGTTDHYRYYKQNTQFKEGYNPRLDKKVWSLLMKRYGEKIVDKIVSEGAHYTHPVLGDFYMKERVLVGGGESLQRYKELIGNELFRLNWDKKYAKFRQKKLFKMKPGVALLNRVRRFNIQKADGTVKKPKFFQVPFKKFMKI